MHAGEIGMAIAILTTLAAAGIIQYQWIFIGLAIGGVIGVPLGFVKTTAVPQRTALSHSFGALWRPSSASLSITSPPPTPPGSAWSKSRWKSSSEPHLHRQLDRRRETTGNPAATAHHLQGAEYRQPLGAGRGRGLGIALMFHPSFTVLFPIMVAISLVFGVLLVMPIGGADMPTVISLLERLRRAFGRRPARLRARQQLLIVAGALDGASGLILSIIMSKAMNRSFTNVLFGAFGQEQTGKAGAKESAPSAAPRPRKRPTSSSRANKVVIVPGYGMAVAQAQHKVRELYDRSCAAALTSSSASIPSPAACPDT